MAQGAPGLGSVSVMVWFLLCLVLVGFGTFQLWRAYSVGRIVSRYGGDIDRATQPRLFWLMVVVFVFCTIGAVGGAIILAPR